MLNQKPFNKVKIESTIDVDPVVEEGTEKMLRVPDSSFQSTVKKLSGRDGNNLRVPQIAGKISDIENEEVPRRSKSRDVSKGTIKFNNIQSIQEQLQSYFENEVKKAVIKDEQKHYAQIEKEKLERLRSSSVKIPKSKNCNLEELIG